MAGYAVAKIEKRFKSQGPIHFWLPGADLTAGAGGLKSKVRRKRFVAKLMATIWPSSMYAQV